MNENINQKPLGICICGLNGSGKTTLAAAVAEALGLCHMDIEDYYFLNDGGVPYSVSRSREEVEELVFRDVERHPRFVFSSVKGSMSARIDCRYDLIVKLEVSKDLRMVRLRERAYKKFGERVLPGGDMYLQDERFFAMAAERSDASVEAWIRTLSCPVIRLHGSAPVSDNVRLISHCLDECGL
ncbi:MAG: AAA family ATPase [Clostridia bacterium]|nr:AAA family ATPase [Clostridia bacterium]